MLNRLIDRIRRNHGLEHATIHVLSEKHRNFSAQGNSDHRGFNLNIYGNISAEDVYDAVAEAHRRLQNGEHHLAVHPNCGTVLLTTATLATLAVQTTFALEQRRQRSNGSRLATLANGLPAAILSVVAALIISRPIGMQLQEKFTVNGNIGEMQLLRVQKVKPSLVTRIFQYMLTGGRGGVKATAYKVETVG